MNTARSTVELLRSADVLREPAILEAVKSLRLPIGSQGVDAGCGVGSHLKLLAEAVSPGGHVTGLDASAEHLRFAAESLRRRHLEDRVSLRRGDVRALPFRARSLDWIWSVDCVGFIPGDPVALVKGMADVVKPGGVVALMLWSSQLLLPGYPLLEARLDATSQGIAPAREGWAPGRHFLRALGWLDKAGLDQRKARTFVVDLQAPLDEGEKTALADIIEMRWGDPGSELSSSDAGLFMRLTDRRSPECILDCGDYFGLFTYTLFWGRVPGSAG